MAKTVKSHLGNSLVTLVIFVLVTGWIFSGWPVIWQNPRIPPRIQEVRAVQSGVPIQDISTGSWTDEGTVDNDGSLYTSVDEATSDNDDSYILDAGTNTTCEVKLTSLTDPGVDTDHVLHLYFRSSGSGGPEKLDIDLVQGTTVIQSWNNQNNRNGTYTDLNGSVTSAGDITNYTDLRVRMTGDSVGGSEELRVTKVELVIPDVANQVPTVDSVAISPTPTVTLNADSTTTVTISATITDNDGCEDVFTSGSIIARFYRSGVGDTCSANNNNCYINITLTEVDDTCTGAGDYTADASGTVNVQFHADPTDEGSYATTQGWNTQNWVAKVTATDASSDSGSNTSTVEMGTLTAFSLDQSSIDYSTVNPDTVSSQQSVLVTTTGNAPIDIQLSGTDMTWSGNTIGVGQQKYSASSGFDWDSAGTALTTSPVCHELSSGKPTDSPSNATEYTYWKLKVPMGKPAGGPYSGTNTFDVVADSVCP